MSKTDKELTTEIVTNYISSWNSAPNTKPIKSDALISIIKHVHATLKELKD
ncbi:hypothetical protein [Lactococcus taiwanensis]|uniref:hypothetical protein n=1 Tax=Lactococcus taiwanensis TaxID=1151742 RepID=UPI0035147363